MPGSGINEEGSHQDVGKLAVTSKDVREGPELSSGLGIAGNSLIRWPLGAGRGCAGGREARRQAGETRTEKALEPSETGE